MAMADCRPGRTCSMAIIPAAATSESVSVDLPAGTTKHTHVQFEGVMHPMDYCNGWCRSTGLSAPLTVVDMGNDGHVPDVLLLVHQDAQLVDGELHLRTRHAS